MLEEMMKRIDDCRKSQKGNNVGTAFYIMGLTKSQDPVDPTFFSEVAAKTIRSYKEPKPGRMYLWTDLAPGENIKLVHAAVIVEVRSPSAEDIVVVHRPSTNGSLEEDASLAQVMNYHRSSEYTIYGLQNRSRKDLKTIK